MIFSNSSCNYLVCRRMSNRFLKFIKKLATELSNWKIIPITPLHLLMVAFKFFVFKVVYHVFYEFLLSSWFILIYFFNDFKLWFCYTTVCLLNFKIISTNLFPSQAYHWYALQWLHKCVLRKSNKHWNHYWVIHQVFRCV